MRNPNNYKPVGEWSGRLLFHRGARLEKGSVLMEVHNAPPEHSALLGTLVELGWAFEDNNEELQDYVDFLTTDVTFLDEAINSSKVGRIHPKRLDGLKNVGPLESLAGARPTDNITVVFEQGSVKVSTEDKLRIDKPPIQIRGRERCLAKFLGNQKGDLYEIRHYNPTSKQFDGDKETIQVPEFPKNNRGLHPSTAHDIEKSPVNEFGWYLYGHYSETSQVFVVESWEPRRALLVSNLDNVISGTDQARDAIKNVIWKGARYKKGLVETHLVGMESDTSLEDWKEGDRCLLIHLFGGIGPGIGGGGVNEENWAGIIPGHFAFGNATVIRDDFTDELQFHIVHRQVYAHNNGGIISGPNMWSSYCGDLERGWLGMRPISDIIVKLDIMSWKYEFGNDISVCPLDEMIRELNEMGARYRTGDGDGSALVNTAHSCVQDSNQALFAALNETYRKLKGNVAVQEWKKANPNHAQTKAMAKLQLLYDDLDAYLTPFGVRKDWAETAKGLRGTESQTAFLSLVETMRTWRTVVPRRAHDCLAKILLKHGAKLWFIRTNQVGGNDPNIIPLAPARAFDYHDNRKDPTREGTSSSLLCCAL